MVETIQDAGLDVLQTAAPDEKVRKTRKYFAAWLNGDLSRGGVTAPVPDRPARPETPPLTAPGDVPKRGLKGKGLIAMVHALAHIELNAIDLGWDIIVRFLTPDLPDDFIDDWARVAFDEALHYELLQKRLVQLGSHYGAMNAHDGLWQAALATKDTLLQRLALVPMTHEARGLDTTPATIQKLQEGKDEVTAFMLQRIYEDEKKHVRFGVKWFEYICARENMPAPQTYHALLKDLYKGGLKPPFNDAARAECNMGAEYYHPASRISV